MKKLMASLVTAAVISPVAVFAGGHGADRDIVRDARGNVVRDMRGNCVNTRWEGMHGGCDGKMAQSGHHRAQSEEQTIYFDYNKAELTPKAKAKLDNLVNRFRSTQDVYEVSIIGYADEIGNVDYNRDLSTRRSQAVRNYLAKNGFIGSSRVELQGLGEGYSVTYNRCDGIESKKERIACLAPDRRVEIRVDGSY